MPRSLREIIDDQIYHVLNRGNRKQNVFLDHRDYNDFLSIIEECCNEYPIKILAYCLMSNHFHLIAQPRRGVDLSKWMHLAMTTYVQRHNKRHQRCGHVWQGRFKSFLIRDEEYLLTALRYVEGNPVRANLAKSATTWLWSSHNDTCKIIKMGSHDSIPIDLPKEWTKFVDEPLTDAELSQMREQTKRGRPHKKGA